MTMRKEVHRRGAQQTLTPATAQLCGRRRRRDKNDDTQRNGQPPLLLLLVFGLLLPFRRLPGVDAFAVPLVMKSRARALVSTFSPLSSSAQTSTSGIDETVVIPTTTSSSEGSKDDKPHIILPPSRKKQESSRSLQERRNPLHPLNEPPKVSFTKRLAAAIPVRWKKRLSKPSTKFRAALVSVAALTGFGLAVLSSPKAGKAVVGSTLLPQLQHWIRHRGFQGFSALGRTVAYLWALLVAYPRLLDRRASERRQKRRDSLVEQRRQELLGLAGEVSRLRQELATIDAEIRSFRREIISLQALVATNQNNNNRNNQAAGVSFTPEGSIMTPTTIPEGSSSPTTQSSTPHVDGIQEAITAEMAHLAQLRADTQAALTVARQLWAEARAQAPPEAWPASSYYLDGSGGGGPV